MTRPSTAAIVLAAGKGTRFHSELAKVLHRAAGRTLLRHVLETLRPLEVGQVVVVVGHQADDVRAEAESSGIDGLTTVLQADQLGTGHAVQQALPALADGIDRVVVLPGDAPLLTADSLAGLLDRDTSAAVVTTELGDPTGYGRVVRGDDGGVVRIVEDRDATDDERAIREINAGMFAFDRDALTKVIGRLDPDNAQGELYLTDVVEFLVADGLRVEPHLAPTDETRGVNDRAQLAEAATILRRRHLDALMRSGVTVLDPATTWVDLDVVIGTDTVVLPGCLLEGVTRIGERASIGPNCRLTDTEVEDDAEVTYAVARGASIGPEATVGPFTYLRPGTRLERGAKAGGFVEMKQAHIGPGSKVPHLSYVGDATIGANVNFSAGAITVNYDGYDKHQTVIGDDAFIGCDTMLVAPVTIGDGALIAAGSTITDDVPSDALAVARQRQSVKDGWAAERRAAREDK